MEKKIILILSLTAALVWDNEGLFADPLSECEKNCDRAHSSIYTSTDKNVVEKAMNAWKKCLSHCVHDD